MTSLFEILKTSKKGMAPDLFTALLAEKFGYTPTPASQQTKTGAPPIYFISDGTPLIAYSIIGNMEQTGTPSKSSPIYPSETGERTEQIFDKNNYINCNGLFVNASTQKIGTVEDGLSLAIPIIWRHSKVSETRTQ